jgi:hypothetical protein
VYENRSKPLSSRQRELASSHTSLKVWRSDFQSTKTPDSKELTYKVGSVPPPTTPALTARLFQGEVGRLEGPLKKSDPRSRDFVAGIVDKTRLRLSARDLRAFERGKSRGRWDRRWKARAAGERYLRRRAEEAERGDGLLAVFLD